MYIIECLECNYNNMSDLEYCDGCGAKLPGSCETLANNNWFHPSLSTGKHGTPLYYQEKKIETEVKPKPDHFTLYQLMLPTPDELKEHLKEHILRLPKAEIKALYTWMHDTLNCRI